MAILCLFTGTAERIEQFCSCMLLARCSFHATGVPGATGAVEHWLYRTPACWHPSKALRVWAVRSRLAVLIDFPRNRAPSWPMLTAFTS